MPWYATFNNSSEFGNTQGLGLIKGSVKKFNLSKTKYIPHMNWNHIKFSKFQNNKITKKLNQRYFYLFIRFIVNLKMKKIFSQPPCLINKNFVQVF